LLLAVIFRAKVKTKPVTGFVTITKFTAANSVRAFHFLMTALVEFNWLLKSFNQLKSLIFFHIQIGFLKRKSQRKSAKTIFNNSEHKNVIEDPETVIIICISRTSNEADQKPKLPTGDVDTGRRIVKSAPLILLTSPRQNEFSVKMF
jgi:hypothetical protein